MIDALFYGSVFALIVALVMRKKPKGKEPYSEEFQRLVKTGQIRLDD